MANDSVGQIGLDLVVNDKSFKKQMNGIQGMAKKAGAALAAAFAVKKLVDFGKACIDLGSDLAEVQNVVDVTFPSMSKQVDAFSQKAATSFGLSETMAKKFTGTFGAMSKAFGFNEQAAYAMSTALTGLAGDVASFYNISQDEAYTKLKSVFTGETESLKDLGVVMTQSALDQYALANGFGKTTAAMSEAEKVSLRYKFVMDQLSLASGDFIRTSGGWANQVRILKLQFDSLKAAIGQGLINVLTPVLKAINLLIGRLMTLANAFKSFTELVFGSGGKTGTTQLAETASGIEASAGAADSLADSTGKAGSAAKKAAKEMRNLMGFDQVSKLSSQDDTNTGMDGSGGIGSAAVDFGTVTDDGETALDKLDSKFVRFFENLRAQLQPTIDSLKRLWNEGFAKLGNFVWTGLTDFYERFLKPVGSWVLGEGIPRFIDALNNGLMKADFQKINDALNRLWDALAPFAQSVGEGLLWLWEKVLVPLGTWVANEVVPRFLNTLSGAIKILNAVLEAFKPLFQWLWDSVLQPIAQWTGEVFLKAWDGINGVLEKFGEWCGKNPKAVENIAIIITSFFAAFKFVSLIYGLVNFIAKFGGLIGIVKSIGALIGSVLNPWVLAIGAIIAVGILLYKNWDTIKEKATELWKKITEIFENIKNGISEKLNTVKECVSEKFNAVKETMGNMMQAAKDTISEKLTNIKNAYEEHGGGIKGTVHAALEGVKGYYTAGYDFIDKLSGGKLSALTETFRSKMGAIKENIASVLESVKANFKTAWNSIAQFVKTPVNAIIGFLNRLISGMASAVNFVAKALNNLKVDIPDWVPVVGGNTLKFNLPMWNPQKIPALAQGGYVKANTPQLAMIGDNRTQGEIVAPESKLLEMAKIAAGSGSPELLAMLREILSLLKGMNLVSLDDESMRKYFIKKTNSNTLARGKSELISI